MNKNKLSPSLLNQMTICPECSHGLGVLYFEFRSITRPHKAEWQRVWQKPRYSFLPGA